MNTRKKGFIGEKLAEQFLRKNGYKILEKNFYCKFGEIDIIAQKDDFLILVEVKMRKSKKYGLPEEAVSEQKLKRIAFISEYYRSIKSNLPQKSRIEVIAIKPSNTIKIIPVT